MDDNRTYASYSQLMREHPAHIVLKLCTSEPMELGDFVSAFTALSSQYEKYIREHHPDLRADSEIFVKEISSGSTIADMFPMLPDLISRMDQILIVENFVRLYGRRLSAYFMR